MGITQMCVCCHKYRQTIIIGIWLILFASTSIFTRVVFMAEGRAISNLIEVGQNDMKEREPITVAKSRIGSRPPKCEDRCRTCGHCEAVQVPVVPEIQSHRSHYSKARAAVTYSRSDDLSNYKPMSWKCKCGDYFFNP